MAMMIRSVRGMNDILPPESEKWNLLENACRRLFHCYGYSEVRTPILESTALFARGIGEGTDIVDKEMYTFADRKQRSMTMRPEMTASCVRAYIQHSVAKKEPVTRWYYMGPMFRYERTQAGRYRQFYQIGVEAFGVAESTLDAEQIAMLYQLYQELGVKNLEVLVNTVGNEADRGAYREVLLAYLRPHTQSLCADCKRRLSLNPLRVLDCKMEGCRDLIRDAPAIADHLGDASRKHFEAMQQTLETLNVPHTVSSRLVRGLDYYSGSVFEIVATNSELGAHNTVAAGGRYDGLVASLGGPDTPAVGFALGVERAILSLPSSNKDAQGPSVYVAGQTYDAKKQAIRLAGQLRQDGIAVELEHRGVGVKAQLRRADKLGARYVVLIGEREIEANTVTLRDMQTGTQNSVSAVEANERLQTLLLATGNQPGR